MIRNLFFDADGVLQRVPDGWHAAAAPLLGAHAEEFLEAVWREERTALLGEEPMVAVITRVLDGLGIDADPLALLVGLWHEVDVNDEVAALIAELRAVGYRCYLATNQNPERMDYLLDGLGYRDLFDGFACSCALGVIKPQPEFFARALDVAAAEAGEVLLIDDSPINVAAAQEEGWATICWNNKEPIAQLGEELARRLPLYARESEHPPPPDA